MVVTDLDHMAQQVALSSSLRKGLEFLQRTRGQELKDGRVEIDGEEVYAIIQSYDTLVNDTPTFEAHQKYLDIQYVAAGEEVIGWTSLENLNVTAPFSEAIDAVLGTAPAFTPVHLTDGQLVVLYPTDAHAPRLAAGAPSQVKKIVVKALVQ
ncbi:MAG: YhcH/YjgK/YiaL family protein [Chloroflexi bacterium]|nr:YhcH/YjgK/YiaL family protein [Chloroflexota bacterium]